MRAIRLYHKTGRWILPAVLVATLVVVVDQLTKAWVMREPVGQLSVGTQGVIPGVLRIAYSENAGIADGLLAGASPSLEAGVIVLVLVGLSAWRSRLEPGGGGSGWLQDLCSEAR